MIRTVMVSHLHARARSNDLREFFKPAGRIRDVVIVGDKNSRTKGWKTLFLCCVLLSVVVCACFVFVSSFIVLPCLLIASPSS